MSIEIVTLLLFGLTVAVMLTGLPVVFAIGGVTIAIAYFLWGPSSLFMAAMQPFGTITSVTLMSLPLFILMAEIMELADIGKQLYQSMHKWFGGLRGGLAVGTTVMGTVVGAFAGGSMTGTVLMAVTGLPEMLKRKYDPQLAIGCIQGAGPLGGIIPPSNIMILYGWVGQVSVGALFMAGIVPGLLLAVFYIVYILVRCKINPNLGPALPPQERVNLKEKFISLKGTIIPIFISIGILAVIFFGIASPTESAAVGVVGAVVSAAVVRKLNWTMLKKAAYRTVGISGMIMWMAAASMAFASLYNAMGADDLVKHLITGLSVNRWVVFLLMMGILLILGCFLDPTPIVFITVPIMAPVVLQLGFNPIWFALLFIVNMEISYLTPPVGRNLYTMKLMAPPEISMGTIIKAGVPFLLINVFAMALMAVLPEIVLWLPNMMVTR